MNAQKLPQDTGSLRLMHGASLIVRLEMRKVKDFFMEIVLEGNRRNDAYL